MGAGGRWTRGRPPRTAAVVLILVAGVLSGGTGVAVAQTANVSMAYNCNFPSGAQRVSVRITASLPKAGAVGQVVSPNKPKVMVTVPHAALGDVTKLGATSVGATEKLTVNVAQSGAKAATSWQNLAAAQTALPADGGLTLEASGAAQGVRPAAPGKVAFVAGPLAIDLMPGKADGTATHPSTISLTCAPVAPSDTVIATVAISDGAPSSPVTGQPGVTRSAAVQASADDFCPPPPTAELNPKFPPVPPPPGEPPFSPGNGGLLGCGTAEGLSNVNKLGGSTPISGIEAIAGVSSIVDFAGNYQQVEIAGFSHLEPRQATLLTFGFVPVSATLEITQLGNMTVSAVGSADGLAPITTLAQGEVQIRLTDAKVNGVPLALGSNCRSSEPVELTLHGTTVDDPPYRVQKGGRLTGEITIPSFKGCGVGEDLDPLLTASVSGSGNLVQVTQGPLCLTGKPDDITQPCPPLPFGFNVDPGGNWTATSSKLDLRTVLTVPQQPITCGSVTMKGNLRGGTRVNPTPIGLITDVSIGSCSGTAAPLAGKQLTVTPVGLPWKLDADFFDPATNTIGGHLEGEKFRFSTSDCSFDALDPLNTSVLGQLNFTYSNSTHVLSIVPNSILQGPRADVTGCTGLRVLVDPFQLRFNSFDLTFDPSQTITQPR